MILTISREEVEAGNTAGTLARLLRLTASRENVYRYKASVILRFDGFDDERELFEIPGLCAFMQALTEAWPYWLWFLKRGSNCLPLLFSFLCRVRVVSGQGGYGAEFVDGSEFFQALGHLLDHAADLYRTYDIPEAQAAICAISALWDVLDGGNRSRVDG